MRHRWLLAMAILSAGCAPEITEGYYACERDEDCLSGWVCRADRRCWSTPGSDVDAGVDGGVDAGGDAGGDAATDSGTDSGTDACVPAARPVDLLVMVDNSNSMQEEQAALTAAFPELVRALVTGDVEPDGTVDFEPVSDLRVGVVSSDMGTGGFELPTCANPSFGDDGILRTEGSASVSGCEATYPDFLEFASGGALAQFRQDFRCVATLGTGGCGFEQQLEAVLKAVTPSDSPTIRFEGDTHGHGGPEGANAGFLRDESLLVVLLVTDEDDCSALDPNLFSTSGGPYAGTGLNLRCTEHAEALHPIARYVDGLQAVRPHPDRLVFAALTGVPTDIETAGYPAILADPRMEVREDPVSPGTVSATCETAGAGRAAPARRIVEAAEELATLGSPTMVRSICRPEFDAPLRQLLAILAPRLSPVGCR